MNVISPRTVNVFHDSRSEIRLRRLYIRSASSPGANKKMLCESLCEGLHEVVHHIIGAQRGVGYERSG